MRRIDQFIAALTLLTRLPVAGLIGGRAWPPQAASVWAYPIVGVMVGAAGGAVLWASAGCGLPRGIAAILAIAAVVLLTGALHEDGLADTADGFGGGATQARKLEIMRDSRIGSYGTLALIFAMALRFTALAAIKPAAGVAALVAAGGLGRGAILIVLLLLRPARSDGIAAPLRDFGAQAAYAGLGLAAASALFLPVRIALACLVGAALAGAGIATLARRQIGGYTGDILGAACVVAECAVLCVAAAAPP